MKLLSQRLAYIYEQCPELEGERGQLGIARASGASRSVVNQWLADKIKSMDIRFALAIEANLGFSHIWLMTGDGTPRVTKESRVVLAAKDNCDEILKLIGLYSQATLEQRNDIIRAAEVIISLTRTSAAAISN